MGSKLTDMDVDTPASSSSSLKRCSSAPMINEINTKMTTSPSTSSIRESSQLNVFIPRARRFSASYSPHSPSSVGVGPPRLTPRVNQLRHEEAVDVNNIREVAHEREIHSAMQMSQSWEDLTLVTDNLSCKSDTEMKSTTPTATVPPTINKDLNVFGVGNRMLPLNISLPITAVATSSACSSPSPTRCSSTGPLSQRQCFSPGIHMAWKTSMSPSPTRKSFTTRRSLSPIAMRPSTLGPVKRKFELDDDKTDPNQQQTHYLCPRAKRFHSSAAATSMSIDRPILLNNTSNTVGSNGSGNNGAGGLLIAQHHNNTSSPLPGSLSSVGTPESLSSADSPQGFTFHPVDSPPTPRILSTSDEPMNTDSKSNQSITAQVQNTA